MAALGAIAGALMARMVVKAGTVGSNQGSNTSSGWLVTAPTDVPEPSGIYTRADRDAYIVRLREQFPQWAAHQSSEGMPRTRQWCTVEQRNAMRAHDQMRVTDSIEWIPYDWPPR